ncbi:MULTISPECIES: DUF998 domain-containing protein [Pseudomonas]|jgi:hypothetical membrane protein|uniref:DUF998 domain-containing protein n=1 Tax=Pseudomonas TaxID=286 RepID=UPI00047003FA|nr:MULTISPECIES: DUF998 domain-containing protein [Pseudomonas]MBB3272555.1 putative membrane protein [Pseudomonas sp. OG7]MCJ7850603.1 DUF998 domain-containing protein [Pseudomonas monteilii]SMC59032.1 Protein of unknown function [Pseudomonas sp. URIL14HWK12:I5]
MKPHDRLLLASGLLIPLWLLAGVWLTAQAYPGYDHLQQAMSQLGAVGSPTHSWSPQVNNFPLAVLFALLAWGLARRWRHSRLALLSAGLVLLHGVGSLGTGWFPCDQGCAPAQPSTSQQLHNLSGLLMFLSLTLASALWAWLGNRIAGSPALSLFSLACVVLAIVTVALMGQALENGQLFGLYQRLNYGVSVIWVAGLAWASLRKPATNPLRMAVI